MLGISPEIATGSGMLGPTLTSEIKLDGTSTAVFLDTGSPVSIVSLGFFLRAAVANRDRGQPPAEWGKAVRQRIQPTTMSLRSYGNAELPIVGQVECCLSTAQRKICALLQEEAPVDLLLGTDVLHQLGFVLTQPDRGDLLGRGPEASATGQKTNSQLEEWQTTVNAAANHTTDPNLPID